MREGTANPEDAAELRRHAEERVRARQTRALPPRSVEEAKRLLAELEVYQIELEMQNEELRTARLEVEAGLQRYTCLYEFAPVGYVTLNLDGVIQEVNLVGASLLGQERSRLKGGRFEHFVGEGHRPTFRQFLSKIPPDGTKVICEVEMGAVRERPIPLWVLLTANIPVRPQTSPAGHSSGPVVMLAMEDLSERRSREQKLEEAVRLLNTSQRVARLGTFVRDLPTGRWSGTVTLGEILGVDISGGVNQADWASLVHPDDREELLEALRSMPGTRVRFDREWRIVNPSSGEVHWLWGLGELESDARGDPVRMVGTIQDVTERRHLEEQVSQAQRLDSIGRLAGGVAHDFNNLLVAILTGVEFLEQGIREGRPSVEDLEGIRQAGERARSLTAQLLTCGRRQVVSRHLVNLNQTLHEAHQLLARVMGEDVTVETKLAKDLWPICGDAGQLGQLILNLAVNARDAMLKGGRFTLETINVDLDPRTAGVLDGLSPGSYVLLRVSDTGSGMTEEAKAHAYEPFFTTKSAGRGTGLGLATVYGIVRQNGGYIDLKSGVGIGTTFDIYFPRAEGSVEPVKSPLVHSLQRGTETILVVEDEDLVRRLVERILVSAGYRVLAVSNGREALERHQRAEGRIDLLLTDVVMSDMDGPAIAAALVARQPLLRVLYMSGYPGDTIARHGVIEPSTRLVAKPFTREELLVCVREVLDRDRQPQAVS